MSSKDNIGKWWLEKVVVKETNFETKFDEYFRKVIQVAIIDAGMNQKDSIIHQLPPQYQNLISDAKSIITKYLKCKNLDSILNDNGSLLIWPSHLI